MIAAATANASMPSGTMSHRRIDNRFSVATFCHRPAATASDATLEGPKQSAGRVSVRWRSLQIQLQISGERVAHALITIAPHALTRRDPAEVLAPFWKTGIPDFTGTGSSISGTKIQLFAFPTMPGLT